jgi:hypothetical protein
VRPDGAADRGGRAAAGAALTSVSIGASGQNEAMGEDDQRNAREPEEQEAAVLPADKAVPIITSGRDANGAEGRPEESAGSDTGSEAASG